MAIDKSFPQDFLRCGKPISGGDPAFYRPVDAPLSPLRTDEDRAEWAYWQEQERMAVATAAASAASVATANSQQDSY